ncbi:hypothetical protein Nmel_005577 [Mimus melanotis]
MGKALSKEEQAMLNVLQLILSKRAVKYDTEVLKKTVEMGTDPPDPTGNEDHRSWLSGEHSPDRSSARPAIPDDETVWRTEKRKKQEREEEERVQQEQNFNQYRGMRRMSDPATQLDYQECMQQREKERFPRRPVSDDDYNPAWWWQGIIQEALVEGQFIPQVFPVISVPDKTTNTSGWDWIGSSSKRGKML